MIENFLEMQKLSQILLIAANVNIEHIFDDTIISTCLEAILIFVKWFFVEEIESDIWHYCSAITR